MSSRLAPPATQQAPAPRFVFQAQGGHVKVQATDRALGMAQLVATMKADPKLHNCVIEQCAFDGELFTALLRVER
jgi:hypothetical protein